MIESLVNAFTRNNNLFSKKVDSPGGDFQQTLNQYDQQMSNQQSLSENSNSFSDQTQYRYEEDNYSKKDELPASEEEYTTEEEYKTEEVKSEESGSNEENKEVSKDEDAEKEEKDEAQPLQPFFNLLEKIGMDKEAVAKIKELIQNPEKGLSKEDLTEFLNSLKSALKNNKNLAIPEGLK